MAWRRRILSDAVLLEVVALPVVLAHLPHPPCALQGAREAERVLPGLEMLRPEGHPEHVHLAVRVQAAVLWLPTAHCHLGVSRARH